jgi:hypothetical protein
MAGAYGSAAIAAETVHEVLAAAEVETGGRLVEQQQLGVDHERAGDLHPLALPLRQRPERALGERSTPERGEQADRPARRRARRSAPASGPTMA